MAAFTKMPHNMRMHLTGYSGLRPLPPAGNAGRYDRRIIHWTCSL